MKKVGFVILALCILVALIEGEKDNRTGTPDDQPDMYETLEYPTNAFEQDSNLGSDAYPCCSCSGSGKVICIVCRGTGENSSYQDLSPVMKGFSKPYCEGCNGNGWITCGRCHGTGQD